MFLTCVVVSSIAALMLLASAAMKLKKDPKVIENINGVVGFPLRYIPVLAALEFAGAVGLLVGLAVAPLGAAAGIGAALYMLGAIIAHIRVKDIKGIATPMLPMLLAIAAVVLRIATA